MSQQQQQQQQNQQPSSNPLDLDSLIPAGLQPPNKTSDPGHVPSHYTKISDSLRRVTPAEFQCTVFCGGRRCKYESGKAWHEDEMAIDGLYSHWVTDDIMAMARPSTEVIRKKNILEQFRDLGIKTIINLQRPGEHASCGGDLEDSGFSYDPSFFMQNDIYFYNFAWKDYGEASLTSLLDMVKVMCFSLTEGKIAVHCHAGLGRTGVLLACYLVYTLRVRANDAIRYVRLKRPNAVQTRGQILCVQGFEQFILPQSIVYCNKDFIKNKKLVEFTLSQFLNRQKVMLHGYEARTFKHIPKVLFVICERLLKLCNRNESTPLTQNGRSISSLSIRYEVSPIPFTRYFLAARLEESAFRPPSVEAFFTPTSSTAPSAVSTRRPSTDFGSTIRTSADGSEEAVDGNTSDINQTNGKRPYVSGDDAQISSISPDMPSCASGMIGIDDKSLDAILGDGIRDQDIRDNVVYQELSSQKDLRKASETAPAPPYMAEEVAKSLLADHELLSEGLLRYIRQYRVDLNHRPSSWMRLTTEKNLYVLAGLLYVWLEHLKAPILTTEDLSVMVVMASRPDACMKKFDPDVRYTLEYLVRFLSRIRPLNPDLENDLMRRIIASVTHRGVPIQGVLKPHGTTYRKLREGTLSRVTEFIHRLMDIVGDDASWTPLSSVPSAQTTAGGGGVSGSGSGSGDGANNQQRKPQRTILPPLATTTAPGEIQPPLQTDNSIASYENNDINNAV